MARLSEPHLHQAREGERIVRLVLSCTFGGGFLVRYLPVDASTMCTTIIGRVMRESSGSASVPMMWILRWQQGPAGSHFTCQREIYLRHGKKLLMREFHTIDRRRTLYVGALQGCQAHAFSRAHVRLSSMSHETKNGSSEEGVGCTATCHTVWTSFIGLSILGLRTNHRSQRWRPCSMRDTRKSEKPIRSRLT